MAAMKQLHYTFLIMTCPAVDTQGLQRVQEKHCALYRL